jgi:hypothetical protein
MLTNKNRLVAFGDSWVLGSELGPDEKSFGQLLSEKLGCDEFFNVAHPGSSINHLTVQLRYHLHRLLSNRLNPSEWIAVFF